ncbi:hypothetical protein DFP72DRAFT_903051 [Ephemerocybe angulata]|uniref:Uncharacterized protein n=1 Tax=Ephemerocybe angulata TaxID=980116 RepID=A0A8H6M5J6_9AGAR|nr:hypothetical protein DFP72DRAFT_903051 [Tulosesus angulatus]
MVVPNATEEPGMVHSTAKVKGKGKLKLKPSLSIWEGMRRRFRRGKAAEGPRGTGSRGVGKESDKSDGHGEDKPNEKWEVSLIEEAELPYLQRGSATSDQIYGFPCWHPVQALPEEITIPGDVGILSVHDGFQRLFNIWGEGDGKLVRLSNTAHPVKLVLRFAAGDTLVKGASAHVDYPNPLNAPSFQFNCSQAEELDTLRDTSRLETFLTHNAGALFKYARALRPFLRKQPLYVVTGAIKTRSWAMAVYSERMFPPHDTLRLVPMSAGHGDGFRVARPRRRGSDKGEQNDMCLFLRGFKVAASDASRVRWGLKVGVGVGIRRVRGRREEMGTVSHHSLPGGAGLGSGSGAQGGTTDGGAEGGTPEDEGGQELNSEGIGGEGSQDEASSSKLPESQDGYSILYHPSDYINEVLLEKTGSDFALAHDDDWRHLAIGDGLSTEESLAAFVKFIDLLEITTKDGVSCLASDRDGLDSGHTEIEQLLDTNQPEEAQEEGASEVSAPPSRPPIPISYAPSAPELNLPHVEYGSSSGVVAGAHDIITGFNRWMESWESSSESARSDGTIKRPPRKLKKSATSYRRAKGRLPSDDYAAETQNSTSADGNTDTKSIRPPDNYSYTKSLRPPEDTGVVRNRRSLFDEDDDDYGYLPS